MRLLIQILAIAAGTYALEIFLPWYILVVPAFAFGLLLKSNANFLGGFVGVALAWGLKIYLIQSATTNDLAARVARILPVQQPLYLIILSLVLAGLIGGFAALSGSLLKEKKKRGYY